MTASLSDRWSTWWEEHAREARASSTSEDISSLPFKFVDRAVRKDLTHEGLSFPSRRLLQKQLTSDLEPLQAHTRKAGGIANVQEVTLMHVLNLVWQPLIEHIDALIEGRPAAWTSTLAKHQDLLVAEMEGVVLEAAGTMPVDEWHEHIRDLIQSLVSVTVPIELIKTILCDIVPLSLEPTRANARSILRAPHCSAKLVGPTLGTQLSRLILSEVAEVPVTLLSPEAVLLGLKQDLVSSLSQRHCRRSCEPTEDITPVKKARRCEHSRQEMIRAKTSQCLWMLENRLAARRTTGTLLSASDLIAQLTQKAPPGIEDSPLDGVLVCRQRLMRHLLLLDGAVDRRTSDTLFQKREEGHWAGVAFATDESPPKQPRFRGLRFQITVLYLGFIPPVPSWESSDDPPISCASMLADIMHCPGKKGTDVSRILERQLSRVGLSTYDILAGTGDGGGENEGSSGIHSHFENLCPGYVRHRCLPHIAWRTMDMAIRASDLDYRALCAYFADGITWSRLRNIAVQDRAAGGLALFRDGSRACKDGAGLKVTYTYMGHLETHEPACTSPIGHLQAGERLQGVRYIYTYICVWVHTFLYVGHLQAAGPASWVHHIQRCTHTRIYIYMDMWELACIV